MMTGREQWIAAGARRRSDDARALQLDACIGLVACLALGVAVNVAAYRALLALLAGSQPS